MFHKLQTPLMQLIPNIAEKGAKSEKLHSRAIHWFPRSLNKSRASSKPRMPVLIPISCCFKRGATNSERVFVLVRKHREKQRGRALSGKYFRYTVWHAGLGNISRNNFITFYGHARPSPITPPSIQFFSVFAFHEHLAFRIWTNVSVWYH